MNSNPSLSKKKGFTVLQHVLHFWHWSCWGTLFVLHIRLTQKFLDFLYLLKLISDIFSLNLFPSLYLAIIAFFRDLSWTGYNWIFLRKCFENYKKLDFLKDKFTLVKGLIISIEYCFGIPFTYRGCLKTGKLARLGRLVHLGEISPSLTNSFKNTLCSYEKWASPPRWDSNWFCWDPI